ncbi:hydrogenase nickel incorporation protein HypB [Shewanella sp. AC91-MNA-CIBAN-0169]|uniref:hydrogenase nickel incorporation protein HypB n=1 Tax=Shewanella TaxID=22 RepID=UPI00331A4326|tara:strand:- start:1975 stop:2751 length:777 start_codon:yes stop_codon:yes gene_type:complete
MRNTCNWHIFDGNHHLLQESEEYTSWFDGSRSTEVLEHSLHDNYHQAEHNRAFFNNRNILVINVMSSPCSGKTSLLEASIGILEEYGVGVAVIESNLGTGNDTNLIRKYGTSVLQITPRVDRHLDAGMINKAIMELDFDKVDILFMENVVNFVCPVIFDLGQHLNIVLLSVAEGDDKASKYPVIFQEADAVLLTKADLLPDFDNFSIQSVKRAVCELSDKTDIITLSAKNGIGMDIWVTWLQESLIQYRSSQHHNMAL